MDRKIVGKQPNFRPNGRHSSFYRSLFWLSLILASIWLLLSYQRGQIEAPFLPSPTPTRNTTILPAGGAGLFRGRQAG